MREERREEQDDKRWRQRRKRQWQTTARDVTRECGAWTRAKRRQKQRQTEKGRHGKQRQKEGMANERQCQWNEIRFARFALLLSFCFPLLLSQNKRGQSGTEKRSSDD